MKKAKENGEFRQRTLFQQSWMQFRQSRTAMIGLGILLVLLLIVTATILIDLMTSRTIYSNYVEKQDLMNKLAAPSAEHIFGCDEFGRDLLFRIL